MRIIPEVRSQIRFPSQIKSPIFGFTLIEVLVTLGVMAILSTLALTIFQNTMATASKSNNLLELQSNGSYVLSLLEQRLRNAESLIAFKDSGTCSLNCPSSWILFRPEGVTPERACIYVGYVHDLGVDPEVWPGNGYLFLQEGTSTQCGEPALLTDLASLSGTVTTYLGEAEILTNRNQEDTYNGVNITDFSFTVDNTTGENPPTVKISLELRQGVSGNGNPLPLNKRAILRLSTTTSLR